MYRSSMAGVNRRILSAHKHNPPFPGATSASAHRAEITTCAPSALSYLLARDLLKQISADFDPHHFTLDEAKAEYAAVSVTGVGTPSLLRRMFAVSRRSRPHRQK